jgi:hypothetical protein
VSLQYYLDHHVPTALAFGLRQRQHRQFAGMVYGHQLRVTIGGAVHDLALIATLISLDDMRNRVEFLPL